MELKHTVTVIAFRSAVRLAGRIERAAQTVGDLSERFWHAVERQADRRGIDIVEVMETLHAERCALIDKRKRTAA
jgi:hypothetical protein